MTIDIQNDEFQRYTVDAVMGMSYMNREIFKFLSGLGDGWFYTAEEVAWVMKMSPHAVVSIFVDARESFCDLLAARLSEAKIHGDSEPDFRLANSLVDSLTDQLRKVDTDLARLEYRDVDGLLANCVAESRTPAFRMGWVRPDGGDLFAVKDEHSRVAVFVLDRGSAASEIVGTPLALHVRARGDIVDAAMVLAASPPSNAQSVQPIRYLICSNCTAAFVDWLAEVEVPITLSEFDLPNTSNFSVLVRADA